MSVTGMISNISRCSVHDGPGLRTVVYTKGCALRCQWCHNPETYHRKPEILFAPNKCIGCGRCIEVCNYHEAAEQGHVFHRDRCIGCGRCAQACPSGALTLCGEAMTATDVLQEVKKDLHFFTQTGGGVTLSGGECLLQPEFSAALLQLCREAGIHTAIESAFCVDPSAVSQVLPWVDWIYADLKLADPEKHRKYTGQDNRLILENLRAITHGEIPVVVRIPLIPGVNDTEEEMHAIGRLIRTLGPAIRGVELLKYNYLAEGKYHLLDLPYHDFGNATQSNAQLNALADILRCETGLREQIFFEGSGV